MQNLGVFGFKNSFFFDILLKVLKYDVYNLIGFALSIINTKIIIRKLFGQTNF